MLWSSDQDSKDWGQGSNFCTTAQLTAQRRRWDCITIFVNRLVGICLRCWSGWSDWVNQGDRPCLKVNCRHPVAVCWLDLVIEPWRIVPRSQYRKTDPCGARYQRDDREVDGWERSLSGRSPADVDLTLFPALAGAKKSGRIMQTGRDEQPKNLARFC